MSSIDFQWDPVKNKSNKIKHGISFEEAKTVFYDEKARVIADPDHSDAEERFIIMGFSYKLNLLIVSHCYRSSKDIIRIISARKATRSESKQYEELL
ncbi:BrnT family toxin [Leptospira semungkisensis]|uniref:BrnT family toxin n=1 Tax=Leptospira semungkisensis TaxID=2484985 RepID=A0A4R9G199_9LEPT|nr:BrnT family toxin [Leptospira semungkisensis]TGK05011.1 BrnT family toxin [Leptospira semungkisensis]